jgi:hypothetical protein
MVIIFKYSFMKPFQHPEIPATAKVLSLVRLHHGLPSRDGEEIPLTPSKGLGRTWKAGARLNRLSALRRRIALEEIPVNRFPVILELSGASQFVILHERSAIGQDAETYLVQFPDSRESLVRADRLRELYDGVCVFLRPNSAIGSKGGPNLWHRLRDRLTTRSSKRVATLAIIANLLTVISAIGVVITPSRAFGANGATPPVITFLGVLMAALVTVGLVTFRRRCEGDLLPGALVGCAFIPLLTLSVFLVSGWAALPFLAIAGVFSIALLASQHLGAKSSAFQPLRSRLLTFSFLLGACIAIGLALTGRLSPALVASALVLGTSLIDRLFDGDLVLRELRLLAHL